MALCQEGHSIMLPEVVAAGKEDTKLVIFDKDGTLIDFVAMWVAWTEELGEKLHESGAIQKDSLGHFYNNLGFDHVSRKVSSTSPLCCSPMSLIQSKCVKWLEEHRSISTEEAAAAVSQIWSLPIPEKTARPLTDLPKLFRFLKNDLGMKIAVCTTDDGEVTVRTLEVLGVSSFVDAVLAGDHKFVDPKPSPNQIYHICERLGVSVQNTIMVGDTKTDMLMGRSAGVGLTVGVMDGASHLEDLRIHADFLVPTMDNFARIAALFCNQRI